MEITRFASYCASSGRQYGIEVERVPASDGVQQVIIKGGLNPGPLDKPDAYVEFVLYRTIDAAGNLCPERATDSDAPPDHVGIRAWNWVDTHRLIGNEFIGAEDLGERLTTRFLYGVRADQLIAS